MVDVRQLHVDSRRLLESVSDRLPPDKLEFYRNLSNAGEWSDLVDVLAASLVKRRIAVTPEERDLLAGVLAMFTAPESEYAYLSDPEGTLAALTLAGQA